MSDKFYQIIKKNLNNTNGIISHTNIKQLEEKINKIDMRICKLYLMMDRLEKNMKIIIGQNQNIIKRIENIEEYNYDDNNIYEFDDRDIEL